MNKIYKHETGFSVFEGILIVLVVALIAVVGWLVYTRNQETVPTNIATSAAKSSSGTSSNNHRQSNQTSNSNLSPTIIKIPELSLEFRVPNSISDLVYTYSPGPGVPLVTFTTKALEKLSPTCGSQGVLGEMGISSGQYVITGYVEPALIKQFPTYYVDFTIPNGTMCSDNPTFEHDIITDTAALKAALYTIQPIN